jgi:hypothetical protein
MNFLNKYKKYFLIVALFLLAFYLVIKFLGKENVLKSIITGNDSSFEYSNDGIKNDSLEKIGLVAIENYVIKDVADVRRTPNYAQYNTIHKLKFGTKIYTKEVDEDNPLSNKIDFKLLERESKNEYVAIYASKPIFVNEMPVGYLDKKDFIKKDEFKDFKPEPIKPKKIDFREGVLATINDNYLINDEEFFLSEKTDRYNKSVVYGDFNNDSFDDFAVVLENIDDTKSGIMIFLFSIDKNLYDLVYKKSFAGISTIRKVSNNTPITINSEETTFPLDGIQLNGDGNNLFHIYNPENGTFMVLSN